MNIASIIVVPTFNNQNTIQNVVDDIVKAGYKAIVVDDGSSPKVEDVLRGHNDVEVLCHKENRGKGAAIITGAKRVKELGYKYFVSMDGDGQHLASQIEHLCQKCEDVEEIVVGSRNFDINNVPIGSKFGRWFSNMWACWDTGENITDSLSGFRLYPISILDLNIKTSGFDWEMEVLVRHSESGRSIKEQRVECYYPKQEDRVSHFRKFKDTMAIVLVHVRILPIKYIKRIFTRCLSK